MIVTLSLIAGCGIGFVLGIQYILWQQKNGKMTPLTPFNLPVVGQLNEERRAIAKKAETETGSINIIKSDGKPPEELKYI